MTTLSENYGSRFRCNLILFYKAMLASAVPMCVQYRAKAEQNTVSSATARAERKKDSLRALSSQFLVGRKCAVATENRALLLLSFLASTASLRVANASSEPASLFPSALPPGKCARLPPSPFLVISYVDPSDLTRPYFSHFEILTQYLVNFKNKFFM